jgi:hypothetical protein
MQMRQLLEQSFLNSVRASITTRIELNAASQFHGLAVPTQNMNRIQS